MYSVLCPGGAANSSYERNEDYNQKCSVAWLLGKKIKNKSKTLAKLV